MTSRNLVYSDPGQVLRVAEPFKDGQSSLQPDHTVTYTYDSLDRMSAETSNGYTHQYQYDLAGNRTLVTYGGSGRTLRSTYDALNRLELMIEDDLRDTRYGYDAAGNRVLLLRANGTRTTTEFDERGRRTLSREYLVNDTLAQEFTYGYDAVSSLYSIDEDYFAGADGSSTGRS